ncbi:hypothetical protein PI23P_10912 [Polaribacter irgensii 23-P]|uniref:HNH endonuclease n=1 Tax=Polaribacter irgensii 23-P TaxID=313594 RepID=A4C135_9FLAO|nr:hypothetical protein [Polaribacter irgensii]EAR11838.1 hypothetical protein PI23P_10912 [Polaribacter irgensii 23-P]
MRDDFTTKTKDIMAKRVGFTCSNPECQMLTVGPNSDENKNTSIGVAAHITAASKKGPRYDENLSSKERQGITNGVWLCQSCSVLIDRDTGKFSIELLKKWRDNAEKKASERLNTQLGKGAMFVDNKDMESIKPNGYYEKEFNGQKVKYFLDGKFLHVEHEQAAGIIAYYVMDEAGNIVEHKWPFPLEQYELIIQPDLILKVVPEILTNGLRKETVYMKWGKVAVIIRNSQKQLVHFHVEKGFTINHVEKKIWINPPEFN